MSRKDEMPTPERLSSRAARYYYKAVCAGICPQCGKPARPGKTLCQPCSDRIAAYQKRRRAERKAARGR